MSVTLWRVLFGGLTRITMAQFRFGFRSASILAVVLLTSGIAAWCAMLRAGVERVEITPSTGVPHGLRPGSPSNPLRPRATAEWTAGLLWWRDGDCPKYRSIRARCPSIGQRLRALIRSPRKGGWIRMVFVPSSFHSKRCPFSVWDNGANEHGAQDSTQPAEGVVRSD